MAALAQSVATALPIASPPPTPRPSHGRRANRRPGMPMGEAPKAPIRNRKRRRRRSRRGRRGQDEAGLAGSDRQLDDGSG